MNVATALNRKYLRYTGVMLTSLCENNPCHIDAYILHSELTDEDFSSLCDCLIDYDITLHSLYVDREKFVKRMYTDVMWSIEAYYRLMLFDLLPVKVDRLFYFDVDIIVNKSIKDFYEMDFAGNDIIACEDDCGNCLPNHYGPVHREMFGTEQLRDYHYFNSGVMLMNVEQMRKKYNYQYYIEVADKVWNYRMEAPDQDLLNYVHWDKVSYVPFERYNLFARLAYYADIPYSTVKEKVSIIHYTWYKPWDGKVAHYNLEQIWWDYAKKTCYYDSLSREFIDQTISQNDSEKQIRELKQRCRELEK